MADIKDHDEYQWFATSGGLAMSFTAKFDRAREHLKSFERESRLWLDTKPYDFVDEPDPDPTRHVIPADSKRRRFRFCRVDPVPERLGLIVGDCLNNLRASLDYLALDLSRAFTPKMTEARVSSSEFPIFGARKMNPGEEVNKIGCIAPAACDVIKAIQPYQRGDTYENDPLWWLHDLNRIDKHRSLTVFSQTSMQNGGRSIGGSFYVGPHGAPLYIDSIISEIKPDAVFTRYGYPSCVPDGDMNVNPDVTPEITFGKTTAAAYKEVIPTLNAICDHVRNVVIAPLSQFL